MKSLLFISFLAILVVGCASNVPLAGVPEAKPASVAVEFSCKTNAAIEFSTARGRNARDNSGNSGLIAVAVGSMIGSGEEAQGKRILQAKIGIDFERESHSILEAVRSHLVQSALLAADHSAASNRLILRIDRVGLRETQRGYWSPYLEVSAKLEDNKKTVWETSVRSTGSKLRRIDEFTARPEYYQEDSAEVIEDVARQLVQGPIRR